jgi:two-component system cell cycle sensor histidine kinase/response regulator CckA
MSSRKHATTTLTIALSCALLTATIWAVAYERIRYEERQALAEASRENSNLAMALEEQTVRTLQNIDQVLGFVRYEYEARPRPLVISELVAKAHLDLSGFSDVALIDESGNRITGTFPSAPVNLADREYFTFQRDIAKDTLFIGKPTTGRLTGEAAIHVSRRLSKPDGSFAGVVLGSLNAEHFARFYDRVDLGKQGLVALVGLDGITRTIRVGARRASGGDMRGSTLMQKQSQAPAGWFLSLGKTDGVPRVTSYRTLSRYPLIVEVATSQEEVLAPVRKRRITYYFIAALANVLVLLLGGIAELSISRMARARRLERDSLREADLRAIAGYERLIERLAILAKKLAMASDTTAVFRSLLDFVLISAPCNGIFVSLYDEQKQQRRCIYAWSEGLEEDVSSLAPLEMTDSPHSRATLTGEVIVTVDFAAATQGLPHVDLGSEVDSRLPQSSIVVPMRTVGRTIGAMEIQSVERSAYTEEHVTALRMAAQLAGMAVENTRLLEEERSLRRAAESSERRKTAILRSALDAIIKIDETDHVIEFNPAAEAIFGYSRDEVLGRELADLIIPPQFRDRHRRALASHRSPGDSAFLNGRREMRAMRKGGGEFPAEISLVRVGDIDPPLFTAFIRDLSDKKRAEDEARAIAARLTTTLESLTDAFCTVDTNWRITYANERMARLTHSDREKILGKVLWEEFPELVGSPFESHYRRAVAENQSVEFEEFDAGSAAWLKGTAYPSPEGLAVYLRDVTASKLAEEGRRSLEAQLRESQKMEALGQLAGGIAHDFNNVLGAILGNLELASEDAGRDPRVLESLREIRTAAHRGRDLIQQILAFSRRQPTSLRVIRLQDSVDTALRLLRAMLPARVQIEHRFAADAPFIEADETQIEQVVLNLGTNAAQAMEGQPGRIHIEIDGVELGAATVEGALRLPAGRYARLRVSDTGHGMDAATLGRIFEPFFTTKPVGEGTGLGLPVVHGIVRAHGGEIAVHSEPGKGTRFELYFPTVERGAGELAAAPAALPPPVAGAGERILYLDDDEALVFLVTRMLERRGYRVTGLSDQKQALDLVRGSEHAFDLVITDYNMPGMSGLDFAREARRIRPDLTVALITGYITEGLQKEAADSGVTEVLFKPNVVEEFFPAIHRLLSGRGNAP